MENKVKLGVGLALVVLIINAFLSYKAARNLAESDELVSHTHQVLTQLEVTLSALKDAETGERGYIITGSEEYLEPYQKALAEIDDDIRKLKDLTADNPAQQARFPALRRKIADRLDSLKQGIDLTRNNDAEGARRLLASGVGKRMMDDLRQFINGMEAHENQLLAERIAESRRSQRDTILTFVVANIVACLVLLVVATLTISGINARARSEQQVREQRQLLQVTLSSIADAVIACDTDGSITFLNPVAQTLTGWSQEEAEGQRLSKVFHIVNEDTRQEVENPALRAMREGTIVGLANHTVLLTKQGNAVPVDDAGAPIKTADGKMFGAILIFRDITSRRKAEQERARLLTEAENEREKAVAASRAKDEFLATLSHELRTPLTAVFGWVQLLQGQRIDDATRTKALEVIDRNIRVQNKLIDDLLNISQIIAGKLQIRREVIDPLDVVKATMETVRPSAEAKQIALRFESDPDVPAISADRARLQQIVWNLLSNAVKFTPKGGTVTVEVRRFRSNLQITVSDTGQGISPEFLPQVFNRFTQADASTTRRHGGLGLGLSLVLQLVELHGGTVSAQSEGIGYGSRFTVNLPVPGLIPPHPSADGPEKTAPSAVLEGVRVLLVEDEPDTREMIANVLQQFGASVVSASSASEALRQFVGGKPPNIVISDIGMPDMDGYELMAAIHAQTPQAPPAIALTAYAGAADKERALQSGFQAHISKPIELNRLISTIAGLLPRRAS
jgi:PAS domain S-box-containing protein